MLTITPEVEAVLARAAELRAEGSSWQHTAEALGYEGDDLKAICHDAGKTYQRLYSKASRAVVRESLAEAMFTLRKLLRQGSTCAARHAAECLARISMTYIRHRRHRKATGPKPDPRLEGMTDEAIELAKWSSGKTPEELLEVAMRGPPIDFNKLFKNLPEGFPFHKPDDARGDDSGSAVLRDPKPPTDDFPGSAAVPAASSERAGHPHSTENYKTAETEEQPGSGVSGCPTLEAVGMFSHPHLAPRLGGEVESSVPQKIRVRGPSSQSTNETQHDSASRHLDEAKAGGAIGMVDEISQVAIAAKNVASQSRHAAIILDTLEQSEAATEVIVDAGNTLGSTRRRIAVGTARRPRQNRGTRGKRFYARICRQLRKTRRGTAMIADLREMQQLPEPDLLAMNHPEFVCVVQGIGQGNHERYGVSKRQSRDRQFPARLCRNPNKHRPHESRWLRNLDTWQACRRPLQTISLQRITLTHRSRRRAALVGFSAFPISLRNRAVTLLIISVLVTLVLFAMFLGGGLVAQAYLYQAPAERLPLRALAAAILVGGFITIWVAIDQKYPRKYDTFFEFAPYTTTTFEEMEAIRWTSPNGTALKVDGSGNPVETVVKFKRGVGAKSNTFFEVGSEEPFQLNSTNKTSGQSYMTVAIKLKPAPDLDAVRLNAQLTKDKRTYINTPDGRRFIEEKGSRYVQTDQLGVLYVPSTGTVVLALLINLLHFVAWFLAFWIILQFTRGHAFLLTVGFGLVTMLLVLPLLFGPSRKPKTPEEAPKPTACVRTTPRSAL